MKDRISKSIKLVNKLNKRVKKGDNFFYLIAQLMKLLASAPDYVPVPKTNEARLRLVMSTIKVSEVALVMFEAFKRAGFSKDEAMDIANTFTEMILVQK